MEQVEVELQVGQQEVEVVELELELELELEQVEQVEQLLEQEARLLPVKPLRLPVQY